MARIKDERICIRLTLEEKNRIKERAKKSRMNLNQYILALNEAKKIYVIDGVPELVVELTRIGTNINQIAAQVNTNNHVHDVQLKKVSKDMDFVKKIIVLIKSLKINLYSMMTNLDTSF